MVLNKKNESLHLIPKKHFSFVFGNIFRVLQIVSYKLLDSKGVIICLGKALLESGEPEQMLLQRCDQALNVQKETNFPIIVSGGDTVKCGITEARVMGQLYFVKKPKVRYNFSKSIKVIELRAIIFFQKLSISKICVFRFNLRRKSIQYG